MEQTWTQYKDEAASAALAPRQWQFIDEAQNGDFDETLTSKLDSLDTSESSGSSCYDSGYENDQKFEGCLVTFDSLTLRSLRCYKPSLDLFKAGNMSDPFAVRMNFKRAYLDKLTSSPATQIRAASYALKYREQDEDLHSCILEHLDACNINLRANIMFFIEHLCESAKREGHQEYISNIERDMSKIINLVAPGTKAGAMNIKVVRKVLTNLHEKSLLPTPLIQKLLSTLTQRERQALTEIANPTPSMHLDRADGTHDLDERDIEQRMEEDRERHKRLREDTWAVDPETELEQLYLSGKAGLTTKLLQDCRDDLKARGQAIELDRLGYETGDTPMGGT